MDDQVSTVYLGACEALPGQTGLFAALPRPSGALILIIARPLLEIVDSVHLGEACNNCFAWTPAQTSAANGPTNWSPGSNASLKTCLGCKVVKYCAKTCQEQAWKSHHKFECKLFARLHPRILPTTVRAVIRLLLVREKGNLVDRDWVALSKLQSHLKDFEESGGERWESICLMSRGATAYSGTKFGEDFVRELYCKMLINSLTLVTAAFDPIGICLDPLAALINHSCLPNAVVTFDGAQLSLRSLQEIKKDEEISISYIDNTDPYHRRQRLLAEQYFFSCACAKCQHGPTLREDRFLGETIDTADLTGLEDAMFRTFEKAPKEVDTTSAIQQLSGAMKTLKHSSSWALDRQPWPAIRRLLAVNYLAAGRWTDALGHLLTIYFHIDPVHMPQTWHPLRVVHNWLLVMLVIHIANLSVSEPSLVRSIETHHLDYGKVVWGLIREVEVNVAKSHGSTSSFAIAVKRKVDELRVDMTRNESAALHFTGGEWLQEEWTKLRAIADMADP